MGSELRTDADDNPTGNPYNDDMQTPAIVQLRPMLPAEFAAWRERFVRDWGEDLARVEDLSHEDALREAARRTDADLTSGAATPGHHLRVIVGAEGELGTLWYSLSDDGAFLDDLSVNPEHRGHGIGDAALAKVEDEVRACGRPHLDLHVYADNHAAIALYQRRGFRTTGLKMRKTLPV